MKTEWQKAFSEWQDYAERVHAHAAAVTKMQHDRGWALAASVGIDRNMCSLHNASIDDDMTGWCHGNPKRLKVAKRARYILDDWTASRLADRIVARAFDRLPKA